MDRFLQDLRFGVRSLLRRPGFTAVALAILALAIGANTAIFSIVNGVLLRPLPYPKPEQLTYLSTQFPSLGFMHFWVSPPEYMELREIARSFSGVGAFRTSEANLTAGTRALRVKSALVDEHLLNVLGVRVEHGRSFAPRETDVAAPPPGPGQGPPPPPAAIVILSHELWQTAFGGRSIVGEMIEIDGMRREVIGIMPRGFDVADSGAEVWLPLGLTPGNRQNRAGHTLYLIARLKDGVTLEMAQTELDALNRNWASRVGLGPKDHVFIPVDQENAHLLQMVPLHEQIVGSTGRSIWALQAAVAFVLLIAGANLASLLIARAETRQRELAVVTALGASRGRLLQQFVIEGALLSIAGGALGVMLALGGVEALVRAFPDSLPRTNEVAVDPVVLLFTLGVSMATGVLFGLAPIMHTRVKGLATALKEGGSKGATSGVRHRVRNGLVIAEVAVAVVLVAGAGLLVRTVYNLTHVDAGFDRSRQVTFGITLPRIRYAEPGTRVQMYQRLLDQLRAVPGVQGATAMSGLPPSRPIAAVDFEIENYSAPLPPEGPPRNVDYLQAVMGDYFETMGIPILQGRAFQRADTTATGMVAVINETLANTFWKGQNPLGQRVRPCCGDQLPWFTIIGVSKDVKQGGVDQKTGTEFYAYSEQGTRFVQPSQFIRPGLMIAPGTMNVVLRTSLPSDSLSQTIERVVRDADGDVPVVRLREMEQVFAQAIDRQRLLAQLVGAFAGLALLLAAIGTYGLLSVVTAERRMEIGIRMALGADRWHVLAGVMKQGLLLTGAGIVIGLASALGLNRLLASLLFGVEAADVGTLAAVVVTMVVVAFIACVRPAWRASRLDPNAVLRNP